MGMEKYKVETHPLCAPESVVQGDKYRISVLTESLLRLEYAEDGLFEDRPTQMVFNRNFPAVKFRLVEREDELELFTDKVHLTYNKQEFTSNGLKISVVGGFGWGSTWMYGQEVRDLGGTARTLDEVNGECPLEHGINSRSGFSVIDDSHTMVLTENGWIEPRQGNKKDIYFFGYGNRYEEAVKDLYRLCGQTPLLPRFALGNWWSRYYRYTEEEYRTLVERFQSEKLPFTVAVLDMDWHLVDIDPKYGSGWTGYTWNKDCYPDPEGFLAWLHEQGMKITLNVHPADGIRAFEECYPEVAKAMGIDPESELPIQFEASEPKFMETYLDKVHHPLEEQGVDFWWVDWQQGNTSKIAGLDPLWMLNHYHYLDSGRKDKRALTFSRYAGVGSHRYPVGFSGDTVITWESLDFQPYFTATASNVGFGWWSHDIGGHMMGYRDDELAARWVQFGVFSPINRLHSTNNDFNAKEPWRFERNARATMERYLRLRHAMIPYLYTMNRYASRAGEPLVKPVYWKEPNNWSAYEVKNEYYFGTEMLVSPITQPADKESCMGAVRTWLPEGSWFDFFEGIVYKGGRMLTLHRSLDDIPVLVKAGGIVPLQAVAEQLNDVSNPEQFEVHIFPGADSTFTIWEDDDNAVDRDENWASTVLSVRNEDDKSVFTIAPAQGNTAVIPAFRSWKLNFRCTKEAEVTVTGAEAKVSYCKDCQTLNVEIEKTSVKQEIAVIFTDGFVQAENQLVEKAYEILNRAQISYAGKTALYEAVKKQGRNAIGTICSIDVAQSVKDALIELLEA